MTFHPLPGKPRPRIVCGVPVPRGSCKGCGWRGPLASAVNVRPGLARCPKCGQDLVPDRQSVTGG